MLCSWFEGQLIRFLHRTMGCFFGCFRVRNDRRPPDHLVSQPINSTHKEPVESTHRNRLSSLLLCEDERDRSPSKGRYGVIGSSVVDINSNELKAEAKFLKACGTLPQTPAEIRNTGKLKDSSPHNGDGESSNFHSWLQYPTIEKLKLEKQPDEPPSPIKPFEKWENESDISSHSSESCMTGENMDRMNTSSAEGCGVRQNVKNVIVATNQPQSPTVSFTPLNASVQCRNKSVHFDCENDVSSFSLSSSSEVTDQESKQPGLPCDYSVSKPSPYPTPLRLTDDMQTPGTVFPAYLHNNRSGKNTRIRSQYVYPVLNPVENFAQLKALSEESFTSDQCSTEHLEQADKGNPQSKVDMGATAVDKDMNVDASLSSWLAPNPTRHGYNDHVLIPTSQGLHDFGRTPGDRPILGMVAAHWNADETSISSKWWDGNGIPNSTTKYREDKKVIWHATPFEERLEKALSENKLIVGRNQVEKTGPMDLEEKEDDIDCKSRYFASNFAVMNSV